MKHTRRTLAGFLIASLMLVISATYSSADTESSISNPRSGVLSKEIQDRLMMEANYLLDGERNLKTLGKTMKKIQKKNENPKCVGINCSATVKEYQLAAIRLKVKELSKGKFPDFDGAWCAWFVRFMLRGTSALPSNDFPDQYFAGGLMKQALKSGASVIYPVPANKKPYFSKPFKLSSEPGSKIVKNLMPGDIVGYYSSDKKDGVFSMLNGEMINQTGTKVRVFDHVAVVIKENMTLEGNRGLDAINPNSNVCKEQLNCGYLRVSSSVPANTIGKMGYDGLVVIRPNYK